MDTKWNTFLTGAQPMTRHVATPGSPVATVLTNAGLQPRAVAVPALTRAQQDEQLLIWASYRNVGAEIGQGPLIMAALTIWAMTVLGCRDNQEAIQTLATLLGKTGATNEEILAQAEFIVARALASRPASVDHAHTV